MNKMFRFQVFVLGAIAVLALGQVSRAQSSDTTQDLCTRVGSTPHSQVIRDKIYQSLKYLAGKPSSKDRAPLFKDYVDIQTRFNELYGEMKNSLHVFTSRKKLCSRYSGRMQDLVNRAEKLNEQLLDSAGVNAPAGLGVDDVLKLIDWVWKKVDSLGQSKKDVFYCTLKWADYSDVVAGTTDKACPAKSSSDSGDKKQSSGKKNS